MNERDVHTLAKKRTKDERMCSVVWYATERIGRFAKVLTLENRSSTGWTGLLCQGRNACPSAGANLRALRSLENLLGRFQSPSVFVNLRARKLHIDCGTNPTSRRRTNAPLELTVLLPGGPTTNLWVTGYYNITMPFNSILSPVLAQRSHAPHVLSPWNAK